MRILFRTASSFFGAASLTLVGAWLAACASATSANTNDAATTDGGATSADGGATAADAPAVMVQHLPATRFASKVVSFTAGKCAGYGKDNLPTIVLGPPIGFGSLQGSTDVVSLGEGGSIVVSVEPNEIVDGPGPDFTVFENAFFTGGNPNRPYADPGEVSISEDGITWYTYPCTATTPPFGACAGWHPVYSAPTNDISPLDPEKSGGDPYDLAGTGLTKVKFIRITDKSVSACAEEIDTYGFDLDAVAVLHGTIEP